VTIPENEEVGKGTPVETDGKNIRAYWLSEGEVGHIMCAMRTYHNLCQDSGAWCSICEEIEAKLCRKLATPHR